MSADAPCECGMKNDPDSEQDRCRAEGTFESRHEHDDAFTLTCTRPAGHDGPHSACTVAAHPAKTWPQETEEADR